MKNPLRQFICLTFCYCFVFTSNAQVKDFTFPSIPKSGKSINDFIPAGWKLKDTVSGNFNQEGRKNVVLVIERKDSLSFEDTTCFSSQPFYPRMSIAVFKLAEDDFKTSAVATKIFGNCNWGIQASDPYVELSKRGTTFTIVFSDGGTLRNIWTYYFRCQNGDWYLIGASELTYWAGHPGASFEDLNLESGIKHIIDRNEPRGKDISIVKSFFKPQPLIKLSDFSQDSELQFTPEHN